MWNGMRLCVCASSFAGQKGKPVLVLGKRLHQWNGLHIYRRNSQEEEADHWTNVSIRAEVKQSLLAKWLSAHLLSFFLGNSVSHVCAANVCSWPCRVMVVMAVVWQWCHWHHMHI